MKVNHFDVTVAICTYRRYKGVIRALKSLLCQTECNKVPILVIDNDPDSNVLSSVLYDLVSKNSNVHLIVEPSLGVSHARNCAIKACETQLLAYLDDDCQATQNWLQNLLRTYHESGPDVAVVGGKAIGEWNSEPPPWFSRPLLNYLSLVDWGNSRMDIVPPQYLVGGNILYSVDRLERIGGFKTHLGRIGDALLSNEELEVCNALRESGGRLIYDPNAIVIHSIASERLTQNWFRQRVFWQAVSDVLLASQNNSIANISLLKADLSSRRPMKKSALMDNFDKDASKPDVFWEQLRAIYHFTAYIASGFELSAIPVAAEKRPDKS